MDIFTRIADGLLSVASASLLLMMTGTLVAAATLLMR
jgi:hypothetical protein